MGVFHSSFYDNGQDADLSAGINAFLDKLPFSPNVPRGRSKEICTTKPYIAYRGRCGGGNRDDYQEDIATIESDKNFYESFDMHSDSTYMYFIFQVPEENYLDWYNLILEYRFKIQHTDHSDSDDACNCRDVDYPANHKTFFVHYFLCSWLLKDLCDVVAEYSN